MDDEMGGKSKQDEKRFKELTSKRTFSLRPPYGRSNEDFNRLAVLCGTSNERDIINDLTGNTRILPINVISINHAAYNEIDKNELFMEAVRAYEEGESWELTREQLKELQETSKDFESTPFERELILKFFKRPDSDNLGTWMTATDIKDILESRTRQQIRSMKRFGIELKNVFGDSKAKRINGTSQRCYFVVDTSNSQSTENEYVPF
jgi:predicted P-loop ATPase